MGEIFLDKALGFLSSDKQKDRADGLAGWFWLFRDSLAKKAVTYGSIRFETYPTTK